MNFISLLLLLAASLAFGQEELDLTFLKTLRPSSAPFSVPLSLNQKGEMSFFPDSSDSLVFQPMMQVGWVREHILYTRPVVLNRFNLYQKSSEMGFIEVKRQRVDAGLGLSAIMKSNFTLGLIPYKGSMQTISRFRLTQDLAPFKLNMPRKLSDLNEWLPDDAASFQTYGGIELYAGFSLGVVNLAAAQIGFQNQFLVNLKKTGVDEVLLKISEEKLQRRELVSSVTVVRGEKGSFEGRRLTAEFHLRPSDPLHHVLYEEALKGNLKLLQEKLSSKRQSISWTGTDQLLYYGIPAIAGKAIDTGHYDISEDGMESTLDYTGTRNRGLFTKIRNLQDFIYAADEGLAVIWSTEMKKTSLGAFDARFYSKGRIMGVKGFDRQFPEDTQFGTTVSQIGIYLSKKEFEAMKGMNREAFAENFRARCQQHQLPCASASRSRKVLAKVEKLLLRSWKAMTKEIGLLLLDEPALIYAAAKTMNSKKEVYFKFLSDRFQSLEGASPIEF